MDTEYKGHCPICQARLQSDGLNVYCPVKPHYKANKHHFELTWEHWRIKQDNSVLMSRLLKLNEQDPTADVDPDNRMVRLK